MTPYLPRELASKIDPSRLNRKHLNSRLFFRDNGLRLEAYRTLRRLRIALLYQSFRAKFEADQIRTPKLSSRFVLSVQLSEACDRKYKVCGSSFLGARLKPDPRLAGTSEVELVVELLPNPSRAR